ncbi:MAG: EAL domain-containing protein [Clostridia bacterium]|nr:EAL domain-containing protein [Clostridia bacterium]
MDDNKQLAAEQENVQPAKKGGRRQRAMELMFEPVFDTHLNMALDYEATVRILDPKMGVMLPEYYEPVAVKSNRICEINRWSVEEGCEVINRADARDASINRLILNVSVRYLSKPYFATQVKKILEKHGVEPDKFCFNITENIYEAVSAQVLRNIRELRDFGFLFSIDDVGVEYTSMSNLSQYEVDYIGINRSLVEPIQPDLYEDEDKPRIVVQGLIDFAKKLGVKTKVGGVDTQELSLLIAKMGADQMQGKFYCTELWDEKKIK